MRGEVSCAPFKPQTQVLASQSIMPTRSCFWHAHKVRIERNILCAHAGTLLDTRLCSRGRDTTPNNGVILVRTAQGDTLLPVARDLTPCIPSASPSVHRCRQSSTPALFSRYDHVNIVVQPALWPHLHASRLASHTVRLVQDAIPEFAMTMGEHLPALFTRLLHDITSQPLSMRRHRCNPRVVKRNMSDFPLKRPEHLLPPKPICSFRESVLLI
jgi:hypothetical protein